MRTIKKILGIFLYLLTTFNYLKGRFPICFEDPYYNQLNILLQCTKDFLLAWLFCWLIIILLIYPKNSKNEPRKNDLHEKNLFYFTGILFGIILIVSYGYLEKCSNDAVGAYNNFGWLVDILNY